jgi:uncharacterized protein
MSTSFIPLVSVEEVDRQALRNTERLNRHPEMLKVGSLLLQILESPLPAKQKLVKAKQIAGKLSDLIKPYAACKNKCSYCCNIAATITDLEAQTMARASGRRIDNPAPAIPREASRMQWFRTPCPFLKAGKCSIYDERPIACRLLFNMADTPYYCDTSIEPENSHVTFLNLKQIEDAYLRAFLGSKWGDIRDFFVPKRINKEP